MRPTLVLCCPVHAAALCMLLRLCRGRMRPTFVRCCLMHATASLPGQDVATDWQWYVTLRLAVVCHPEACSGMSP